MPFMNDIHLQSSYLVGKDVGLNSRRSDVAHHPALVDDGQREGPRLVGDAKGQRRPLHRALQEWSVRQYPPSVQQEPESTTNQSPAPNLPVSHQPPNHPRFLVIRTFAWSISPTSRRKASTASRPEEATSTGGQAIVSSLPDRSGKKMIGGCPIVSV